MGDGVVGVVVDVDEARCDGKAFGINSAFGGLAGKLSDGGDALAAHGDVGVVRGISRAIHDAAAGDQQVERLAVNGGESKENKESAAHCI